ncbi:MAG: histidine phosphatase family protein [Balneolaceae bacterium]|nr:histidine phosphatase family protein [Balneolaceae bacterium]
MKNYKLLFVLAFTLLLTGTVNAFQISEINADETLLIFVRHTEKADDGTRNPPLNMQGLERANALVVSLKDLPIAAIYSTNYKRTEMTGTPTAFHFELPVNNYDFDNLDAFLSTLISKHKGEAVLIVGHSNTTPRLVNMVMQENRLEQIDEKRYGDLFLLYTKSFGDTRLVSGEF